MIASALLMFGGAGAVAISWATGARRWTVTAVLLLATCIALNVGVMFIEHLD